MSENNESHYVPTGDQLLKILEALANPHRLRILATLQERPVYVSQLARIVRMSRPLLYMHLKRLEEAGLVTSKLALSADGKAMNFYSIEPFKVLITPDMIAEATESLTIKKTSKKNEE